MGKISSSSKEHLASIINFSGSAFCEVNLREPVSINISSLSFSGGNTNFSAALKEVYNVLFHDSTQFDIAVIFMTDGQSDYPKEEIKKIKKLISDPMQFKNKKFKFFGLGFNCKGTILNDMTIAFGGLTSFATDGNGLTSKYCEILTKSLE